MLKTNIEWLKKNMGPDLKIWTQMIKEIDWGEVKRKTKLSMQRDKERVVGEFKSFMAMSPAEKMDIVMNVGKFRSGEDTYVLEELRRLVDLAKEREILTKVIIETRALSGNDEILRACDLVIRSGADFVKTGTGWIPGKLDLFQAGMIKGYLGDSIKLKVAGGIRTREEFIALVNIGVERMGINTQSAMEIVEALDAQPSGDR